MATVSTASPTVTQREQKPPVPEDRSLAGIVDLATLTGWSFVASFAYPEPHFEFTYNNVGPTVDIGNGRVSRFDGDEQRVYQVSSVSGLSLATDTKNYVFFREDNVIEVQDGDNPPSGGALLIGTVDTTTGTVETGTRGRSPVSPFEDVFAAAADAVSDDSGVINIEAEDMADATQRFQREYVPDGEVCEVTVAGVMDASNTTTTGLAARVVDDGDATEYHTTEAKRATGDPLARVFGPADLRFEVDNQSGDSVTEASGRWEYAFNSGQTAVTGLETSPQGDTLIAIEAGGGGIYEYDVSGGTWTQTTSAPDRIGEFGGSYDPSEGNIYFSGNQGDSFFYDVSTQSTGSIANRGSNPEYSVGVTYGDEVYNSGGNTSTTHAKYDPDANSWVYLSDIPRAMQNSAAARLGECIHMWAGVDGTTTHDDHYVYDVDADSWSSLAPYPTTMQGHGAVTYNRQLWSWGGQGTGEYKYDPGDDSWSSITASPNGDFGECSVALGTDDRAYILTQNDRFEAYDFAADSYTSLTGPGVAERTCFVAIGE